MKLYVFINSIILSSLFSSCTFYQEKAIQRINYEILENISSVSVKNINQMPKPFTDKIYFLTGYKEDEEFIIDKLIKKRFEIKRVWLPYKSGPYWGVSENQIIVELKNRDEKIYSYNFSSDTSKFQTYNVVSWKCFEFEN